MILIGDLLIIAAYMAAIIIFKKHDLIQYFILFFISVLAFNFIEGMIISGFEVHLIYLIIFSYSYSYYKFDKVKICICSTMVILQGITSIDAYFYNDVETTLYLIYPAVIGVIHIAFICSSIGLESIKRFIKFNFDIICNTKIV